MKKITKKITALLVAFAIAFTCMPVAMGSFTASAASAPGTVQSLRVKFSHNYAYLRWSRVKKNINGYAIYRNGKLYKTVLLKDVKYTSKKRTLACYKDSKVKPNTNYNYYVKAFRYTGKTKTQWYNKNTKKWQDKKPAKMYRGKSRKVKLRKYGKASPVLKLKTKSAPKAEKASKTLSGVTKYLRPSTPEVNDNSITLKWTAHSGAAQFKIYRNNQLIKTLDKNTKTYIDKGLAWDTEYSYIIEAYEGGKRELKATASATTMKKSAAK